jgi:hypothetical protein
MEQLTPELLGTTALALLFTFLGGCLWVARVHIWEFAQGLFHRYARVDYVNAAPLAADDDRSFPHSRPEAEVDAARKLAPGSGDGMVVMTQVALQGQLDAATEDGMVRMFALLHKGGYLPAGKATEIKRAAFGVAGGRRLQRLNQAIDAVVVDAPAPPAPRQTPIAQRRIASDLEFAGELPE